MKWQEKKLWQRYNKYGKAELEGREKWRGNGLN